MASTLLGMIRDDMPSLADFYSNGRAAQAGASRHFDEASALDDSNL